MIIFTDLEIGNVYRPLMGMRNSYDSQYKSDTTVDENGKVVNIGVYDASLIKSLVHSGSSHRKFLRQIPILVDIKAPLYWWKEFDTYKIGTTANSESTMHTIHKKSFDLLMFSTESLDSKDRKVLMKLIEYLEELRMEFLLTKDKKIWYKIIQLLPSSFNQRRTVSLNYEVLLNIYNDRKNHRLDEWREFCKWIEEIDYADILLDIQK